MNWEPRSLGNHSWDQIRMKGRTGGKQLIGGLLKQSGAVPETYKMKPEKGILPLILFLQIN